jgi:hypothetical protein
MGTPSREEGILLFPDRESSFGEQKLFVGDSIRCAVAAAFTWLTCIFPT